MSVGGRTGQHYPSNAGSLRTVYRLLQRGELTGAFYVGGRIRIPAEALTALIGQHPRLADPEPCKRTGTR